MKRFGCESELERDRNLYGAGEHGRLMDVFKMPTVWILAAIYIIIQIGVYIVNLWMPLILASLAHEGAGRDASVIARYATVPYLLAAIFTVVVGWSSDKRNERQGTSGWVSAAGCGGVCVDGGDA